VFASHLLDLRSQRLDLRSLVLAGWGDAQRERIARVSTAA
jgi:hypothetical protein